VRRKIELSRKYISTYCPTWKKIQAKFRLLFLKGGILSNEPGTVLVQYSMELLAKDTLLAWVGASKKLK
jgi:hypothetical protein